MGQVADDYGKAGKANKALEDEEAATSAPKDEAEDDLQFPFYT